MSSALLPPQSQLNNNQRNLKKVPFVEMFNGRLQGVVSSGSSGSRVYVSCFTQHSLDYYCSTNNNRPCGGLRGSPCKHLQTMLHEATLHYGLPAIVTFLQPTGDPTTILTERDLLSRTGQKQQLNASDLFSRFLAYLQHLDIPPTTDPLYGMNWFR
ncbi:MAG TPA: hypothetical protein VLL52_23840 [Anaerolineae bacterium]|nr:hypothetical protein [Anaerolineae bacterium]